MRTKSKFPKTTICLRLDQKQLEKIEKIAENKRIERSELIRRIIDNYVKNVELEFYA